MAGIRRSFSVVVVPVVGALMLCGIGEVVFAQFAPCDFGCRELKPNQGYMVLSGTSSLGWEYRNDCIKGGYWDPKDGISWGGTANNELKDGECNQYCSNIPSEADCAVQGAWEATTCNTYCTEA